MRRKAHPISCSSLTQWASKIFGEFKLQKNCNQAHSSSKMFFGQVKMTLGLVHATTCELQKYLRQDRINIPEADPTVLYFGINDLSMILYL